MAVTTGVSVACGVVGILQAASVKTPQSSKATTGNFHNVTIR
jgi:hypothetical protein